MHVAPQPCKKKDQVRCEGITTTAPTVTSLEPLVQVDPHTLILGSVPSPKSNAKGLTRKDIKLRGGDGPQNFGHPRNCFWNIVGSALGFRRDQTPYADQVQSLTTAGFALWDVVAACERVGALDKDITRGSIVANDIPGFLRDHPTVDRLVFHRTAAELFTRRQAFAGWLETGESPPPLPRDPSSLDKRQQPNKKRRLDTPPPLDDSPSSSQRTMFVIRTDVPDAFPDEARRVFDRKRFKAVHVVSSDSELDICVKAESQRMVTLVVLPSTSPANAKMRPPEKEMMWHKGCFRLAAPPESYVPLYLRKNPSVNRKCWVHEYRGENAMFPMPSTDAATDEEDDAYGWYR